MELLEREAHLASLAEYAGEASQGHGRMVLLSGEAGVGKSTLLERFEEQCADAAWYWGSCDGLFTPLPLAPVVDIGRQIGGELDLLCRTGAAREQLFDAVLGALQVPERPTVLVIEDAHWADEATLDLLRFLGSRIRTAYALVLVSYRDDHLAAGDSLQIAVGELSTQRTTRRIALPALSETAVATMADGTRMDASELYRLTGGNPFYVSEVLQTTAGNLPSSVRDAVLARLGGLDVLGRRVLGTASLLGTRIDPDALRRITDATPASIDAIVATGVVIGDADGLRFRHEIARLAVQATMPPHQTTAAHRSILEHLHETLGEDDARWAYHAEAAGDDELVLRHAPSAGRRASALGAHREAVLQFERALRAAPRADDRTRATLHDSLAQELALVDRWRESATERDTAVRLWRDVGDPVREGDSLRRYSRTMWRLCRGADADRASVEALSTVAPLGPRPELAWVYANLANHRLNRGEHEEAILRAREAREIAESLDLVEVVTDSLNTEACASAGLGAVWSPMLHRALELAKEHGLDEQAGRAYANLYSMYSRRMRIPEGEGVLLKGIAYCEERDISTFGNCLRGERSVVLVRLGRYDEAETMAQQMLARTGPSPVNRLNPLISAGLARARRGNPGVWECLDEANELATGLDEQEWIVLVRLARAEAFWLAGDEEAARSELDLARPDSALNGALEHGTLAVWRHRISGGSATGTELIEPFETEINGAPRLAAAEWESRGLRYDAAMALLGSPEEVDLREALDHFELLGAIPAAGIARQRLRSLGVRPVPAGVRASTKSHPAGLTRREQQVLELVSLGLSNDEIAKRLFLSVKTVEHHVSAILAKLGVTTRKAAASEAAQLGLLETAK